jgi:hypothetical protein
MLGRVGCATDDRSVPGPPELSIGFGFCYEITQAVDFKAQFLFPNVNNDTRYFGFGAGVQARIE